MVLRCCSSCPFLLECSTTAFENFWSSEAIMEETWRPFSCDCTSFLSFFLVWSGLLQNNIWVCVFHLN
jgi:hypothetical protein